MDSLIKSRWIEALRSGEYKQGRGGLRNDDFFCCLGVLCDLHSKETGTRWDPPNKYERNVYDYLNHDSTLPHLVMKWMKLETKNIYMENVLMELNDGKEIEGESIIPKTFLEIADFIQENM